MVAPHWIYTALNAHCAALSYIRTYRSKKCEAFASLGATATLWASIRYTIWEPFTWLPAFIRMLFCTAGKCLRCWFFLLPFLSMGIQTMTFITIFAQTASRLMDCDVAKLTFGSCWWPATTCQCRWQSRQRHRQAGHSSANGAGWRQESSPEQAYACWQYNDQNFTAASATGRWQFLWHLLSLSICVVQCSFFPCRLSIVCSAV